MLLLTLDLDLVENLLGNDQIVLLKQFVEEVFLSSREVFNNLRN